MNSGLATYTACAKNFALPDVRGEDGARKMGFPHLKYVIIPVFIVTLISNSSGIASSQDLAASDIPKIMNTYYENKLEFKRDYLGKTLTATMFFNNVREKAFVTGYFVGFDGVNGSAGLTCSFSETLPSEFIDWDAGKSVSLTGVVSGVVLATLYLERCEFK